MSNVEEGLFHLDAHEKYGDAIQVSIQDIHAFASYNSGWIGTDFLYETPRLVLELESRFGDIHIDIPISNITSGNLDILLGTKSGQGSRNFDIRDLIGECLHLSLNGDFTSGTLWPHTDTPLTFNRDCSGSIVEPDRSLATRKEDNLGIRVESRSIEWMNKQLRADYERNFGQYKGWLERTVSAVEPDGETVRVYIDISDDWRVRWEFDDSFKGYRELRSFAEYLGHPADVDELEGSIVYLCPVRDIPHTAPRDSIPLDALERWGIVGDPIDQSAKEPSFLSRLWDAITPSNPKLDVSVGSSISRSAKSSDDYAVYDECRAATQDTAKVTEDNVH